MTSLVPSILPKRLQAQHPLQAGGLEQALAVVIRLRIRPAGKQTALDALNEIDKPSLLSAALNGLYGSVVATLSEAGAMIDELSMDGLTAVVLLEGPAQAGRIHQALVNVEKALKDGSEKLTPGYPNLRWTLAAGVGVGTLALAVIHLVSLDRRVFLMAGPALDQAESALGLAQNNQIVVHRDVLKRMGSAPSGQWIRTQFFLSHESYAASTVAQMMNLGHAEVSVAEADSFSLTLEQEEELASFLNPALRPGRLGFSALASGLYAEHITYLALRMTGLSLFTEAGSENWHVALEKIMLTVTRYQGIVHQITSKSGVAEIRILFGLADDQENIERRAVSCALALQRTLKPLEPNLRIAIASDHSFVGLLGASSYQGLAVISSAVQQVKALIERAEAREILVSQSVQENTNKTFSWKPVADSVGYVLAGEVTLGSGLTTRVQLAKRTPLMERETELEQIKSLIDECLSGETKLVIMGGKAGHGRSTLIDALIDQWLLAGGTGFIAVGPSYTPSTPYELWFPIWQAIFELTPEAAPEQNLATLEKAFERLLPGLHQGADLFADVLGLVTETPATVANLSPRVRQRRLFEANLTLFSQLAEVSPVVLAFEHLDFADSLSLELIQRLSDTLEDVPLLFCLEDRGDPDHSLRKQFLGATILEAKPLSGQGAWRLFNHFLPGIDWPPSHKRALEDRLGAEHGTKTETLSTVKAIPAYVVALATSLKQSVVKRQGDSWKFDENYPPQTWPLDSIETTKLLLESVLTKIEAQIALQASVGGLLFFHQAPWLRIANTPIDPTLEIGRMRALQLTDPHIDLGHGRRWDRFRHENVRAALYLRLNTATRLALHVQVAEWCREHQPGKAGLAVVGYHLQHSGQPLAAVNAYLPAAEHAADWGAESEALQHLLAAERLLASQTSPEAQKAQVWLYLSRARLRLKGDLAKGMVDVRQAVNLAEQLGDKLLLAQGLLLRAKFHLLNKNHKASQADAERAIVLAQDGADQYTLAQALWVQAKALAAASNYRQAVRLLARAISVDGMRDSAMQVEMGIDSAMILMSDYYRDRALEQLTLARDRAEKLDDPVLLHQVLKLLGHIHVLYGEAQKAVETLEKALTLPPPPDSGLNVLGDILTDHAIALCYLGQYADAEATFETAHGYYSAEDDEANVLRVKVVRACESMLDHDQLDAVQAILHEVQTQPDLVTPHLQTLIDLTQVAVHIRRRQFAEARTMLDTLAKAPETNLKHWYAPLRHIREAELALAQNELDVAIKFASQSLGAVSLQGDIRFLTLAYCLLAEGLILQHEKPELIQDALERAVKTGHSQGRRVHLARAFYLLGQYLRNTSLLYSSKARGSTYLFEADLLFKEMNIAATGQVSRYLADLWGDNGKPSQKGRKPR